MGFRVLTDINTNTGNQPNSPSSAVGIKFLLTNENSIRSTFTSNEQARVNLINLLTTTKKERLYHPNFGSDLLRLIFNPISDALKQKINDTILSAVSTWLPYITINNIEIKSSQDDVNIDYDIVINLKWTIGQFSGDDITFTSTNGNIEIE